MVNGEAPTCEVIQSVAVGLPVMSACIVTFMMELMLHYQFSSLQVKLNYTER